MPIFKGRLFYFPRLKFKHTNEGNPSEMLLFEPAAILF